jgi:hypothetical protein
VNGNEPKLSVSQGWLKRDEKGVGLGERIEQVLGEVVSLPELLGESSEGPHRHAYGLSDLIHIGALENDSLTTDG